MGPLFSFWGTSDVDPGREASYGTTMNDAANRICPECGASFKPENGRQRFCTVGHKQRFHRLMEKRGRLLTPIAISWQANCRSTDERRAELAKYARNQKDGLLRKWAAEDREAGRNCDLLTAERQEMLWQYVDAET